MEIGQRFKVRPVFAHAEKEASNMQWGTVIWIHPLGRYAVLEFEGIHGKPRECFSLFNLLKKR